MFERRVLFDFQTQSEGDIPLSDHQFQLLHLSDIHINKETNFDRSVVLDPLIDRIKKDMANGLSPEIIVVTGDIAHGGKEEEYKEAKLFFDELLLATGLSNDKLFMVPGNHDVNRKKYRPSDRPTYNDMQELNSELENKDFRDELFKGMAEYFSFTKSNYPHLSSTYGTLVPFVNRYQVKTGQTIGLVGLNSAWMCRKSPDENEIAIGEFQVKKATEELAGKGHVDLTINLFHHPLQWLWKDDRNKLKTYLDKSIILSGHLHDADGGFHRDLNGSRFLFQAGGAYLGSESKWPARYQYMTFNWNTDEIRLDYRKFVKKRRIWSVDGETGNDGVVVFNNTGIKSKKDDPIPAPLPGPFKPDQTPRPLVIPESYKNWIKQECSYMQVDKMAGKGQVIRPELPEVFVPLYAQEPGKEKHKKKKKGKNQDTGMDEKSRVMNLETLIAQHEYLLIEGQAGSGKTTVLKHLAYVLAGGEDVPAGLSGFLPVLIFLKDLKPVLDELKKGAVLADEILGNYFKNRNNILETGVLSDFIKAGKTLFLLDGLDEISETNRDKVVKSFSDFRCKFSGNKVVFSGRPHGLDGTANNLFGKKRVSVLSFNTEQIHEFINNWFLHVYSESEIIGKRNAKDMIAEINGHEAIHKLVDNPLMLTAICILYHDGRELPNQRAELYKKFIDNMVYRRFDEPEKIQTFLRILANDMHKEGTKSVDRSFALKRLASVFRIKPNEAEQDYKNRLEHLFDEIEPQCGLLRLEDAQHSFWHLTFQEYLTAVYTVDTNTQFDDAILQYWDNPWYEEVVKLYVGYLSIEHKQWATQIIRKVLEDNSAPARRKLLAAEALVDIHPDRQDPDLVDETRAHMWTIIDQGEVPKDMASCGEVIGYLGDTRNLNAFVRIEGVLYDLEELGKTEIKPFEIGQFPVTNAWFAEFIHARGYETEEFWSKEGRQWLDETKAKQPGRWDQREWRCPNAPVVGVSWYEADAFTRWLTQSRADGFIYRLPSEKEWQAAAAGKPGRAYPWGADWDKKRCNNKDAGIDKISSVGLFKDGNTRDGVSDLSGNVWEWTNSDYHSRRERNDFLFDPELKKLLDKNKMNEYVKFLMDKKNQLPVLRGGSWSNVLSDLFRCAFRDYYIPLDRDDNVGFRCART